MLSRTAKQEIKSMSHRKFSYEKIFGIIDEADKKTVLPHQKRAESLGIYRDELPVSPRLTKFNDSRRNIDLLYNLKELEEQGINPSEMLLTKSEEQVIEELEEMEIELTISPAEAMNLMASESFFVINSIPYIQSENFIFKQIEESSDGKMVDVSAFATQDFLTYKKAAVEA